MNRCHLNLLESTLPENVAAGPRAHTRSHTHTHIRYNEYTICYSYSIYTTFYSKDDTFRCCSSIVCYNESVGGRHIHNSFENTQNKRIFFVTKYFTYFSAHS